MLLRRLLVRPAESFRITETCPRDSAEKPPSGGTSPPPARKLSAPRTATLHHTTILRRGHGNPPGPARQLSGHDNPPPRTREPSATSTTTLRPRQPSGTN